jgi:preprotein translocase subunit SecA
MRLFKGDMVDWFMRALKVPDDVPIEDKRITKMIQNAQEQVEAQHFDSRKNVLKYDDVMNRQRYVVYQDRRRVLEGADIESQLRDTVSQVVTQYVQGATEGFEEEWDLPALWKQMETLYPVRLTINTFDDVDLTQDDLVTAFVEDAQLAYDQREAELGAENMRKIERQVLLSVLDRKWREHLYEMDYLREGIGLRSMAQRDPLVEYQREGAGMFLEMMDSVMEEVVSFLFHIEVQQAPAAPKVEPVVSRKDARKAARQALAAEEAAARSEIHITADGILAPSVQRSQVIKKAAKSTQSAATSTLRESRPGASGRRNKKKR